MRMRNGLILLMVMLLFCAIAQAEDDGLWYPVLSEELPEVFIVTDDGRNHFADAYFRDHKLQGLIDYVPGAVSVRNCDRSEEMYDARAQIKVRGNWTLEYPKKSIRIKFERKQSMLGLNGGAAYKDWVLLAEWKDLSKLHSPVGLFLAHNILGADGYYCTDYRLVHLHVNGDYRGVYLLVEQQEVAPGRIEIDEPAKDSTDRYTGYLMEYDAYFSEEAALPNGEPTFQVYHTGMGEDQQGYTVKSTLAQERHVSFLRTVMRLMHRICYEAITSGEHYAFNEKMTELVPVEGSSVQATIANVIDLPSLVDTYILQEIICNPDVGWSSFYMTLDLSANGNRKLTFQAPWDFDSAFGIRAGYESSQGMYALHAANPWLQLIASQPWFTDMVRARWSQLTAQGLPEKTLALIHQLENMYADDFARNYERWPQRISEGNHELIDELNSYTSQSQAADYLHRWLTERFAYLNKQWK